MVSKLSIVTFLALSACAVGPELEFYAGSYALIDKGTVVQTEGPTITVTARAGNPLNSVQLNVTERTDVKVVREVCKKEDGCSVTQLTLDKPFTQAVSSKGEASISLTASPNFAPGFTYAVEAVEFDDKEGYVHSESKVVWLIDGPEEELDGD